MSSYNMFSALQDERVQCSNKRPQCSNKSIQCTNDRCLCTNDMVHCTNERGRCSRVNSLIPNNENLNIIEKNNSIHNNYIINTEFPSLTNTNTIPTISEKWRNIIIKVKTNRIHPIQPIPPIPPITHDSRQNSILQTCIDQAFANKPSIKRKSIFLPEISSL